MATRSARHPKPPVDPALLAAILDDPASDGARLALAHALSAQGDPRGEFISAQVEYAALGEPDEPTHPLVLRIKALSRGCRGWAAPFKPLGVETYWGFHRGFVRSLGINSWDDACTAEHLAAALAVEPVTELQIPAAPSRLAPLLEVPGIERLRRLVVSGWLREIGGGFVAREVTASSRLRELTELRLGVKLGDEGLMALAEACALDGVTHLALGGADASLAAFDALMASPMGQRLETLEWCRDKVSAEMAPRLVRLPRLRTLVVSEGYTDESGAALRERFGEGFVVEDEPSMEYLFQGVKGVSWRPKLKK